MNVYINYVFFYINSPVLTGVLCGRKWIERERGNGQGRMEVGKEGREMERCLGY